MDAWRFVGQFILHSGKIGGAPVFFAAKKTGNRIPGFLFFALYTFDFPGFQSASGNPDALRFAVHQNAHFLQVRFPGAFVCVHGVRTFIAGYRFTSCNCTFFRHCIPSSCCEAEIEHIYAFISSFFVKNSL